MWSRVQSSGAFEGNGTSYVAPLPGNLQNFTRYDAAIMKSSREPEAAAAFLQFLTTPTARRMLEAAGIE